MLGHGKIRSVLGSLSLRAAVAAVMGITVGALAMAPTGRAAEPVFRLGTSPTGILVWLAEDYGLLAASGANIEVSRVSSGVEALNLVQSGDLELGASSEFAFVSRAVDDRNLCIYATISASRTVTLLARSDRVTADPADLAGKRIGVTLGSVARFMLWQFLALAGVDEGRVTLVDLTPDEMVAAMRDGTVDASIVWEPYVTAIRNALPVPPVSYKDQTDQHYYFALQGRCDLEERRPDDLRAVLAALIAAERRLREDEASAKSLFAARFGIAAAEVDQMWPQHSLSVRLPQDLVPLMEAEARWRVSEALTDRTVPNLLDHIRPGPLESVAPQAVQIIR